MFKDKAKQRRKQQARRISKQLEVKLFEHLRDIYMQLDRTLDRRLVVMMFGW
jgi:hypothetical protein